MYVLTRNVGEGHDGPVMGVEEGNDALIPLIASLQEEAFETTFSISWETDVPPVSYLFASTS